MTDYFEVGKGIGKIIAPIIFIGLGYLIFRKKKPKKEEDELK
jgi:hypothetical protein